MHPKRSLAAACPRSQEGGELPFLNDLAAAPPGRFRTFALNDTTIT
jgi:hypothetical protein